MTSTSTPSSQILQAPYLREQRQFPFGNVGDLARQVDQAYIDIAAKVNLRTIGVFAVNFPVITGDIWYFQGETTRRQSFRQVYNFTAAGNIPHGIKPESIFSISPNSYGTYTDATGTNYYGVIFGTSVAIAGQVSFYVTSTNIVVLLGGGAPAIDSGFIVLEWISTL